MSRTDATFRYGPSIGGASIGPLPHPLTPLVGREPLIASTATRLVSPYTRLLTLIGPGGIGKTRLAIAIAHEVSDCFRDGAVYIRLASVTDPSLVLTTVTRALGIRNPDRHSLSWSIAQDREVLLLIDNFEQLLPAATDLVNILSWFPGVTMLVTSRTPLHVTGEHQLQVPPLEFPDPATMPAPETLTGFDAVRLFVDRAAAATGGFELTAENAVAVATIVRDLDGIPLALELAAAQSKHLPLETITARLAESSLVLTGGPVDRPPHQRAIHETIAWSYDLLDPVEQQQFRYLSIFAGGFTVQAADGVCAMNPAPPLPGRAPDGESFATCVSLSDKSLIYKMADQFGEPRFSMLLTIRGFGHQELRRLGEWEDAARRHAAWYLALAEGAGRAAGREHQTWMTWLEVEIANLRAALDALRTLGDQAAYARLASALGEFWLVRGHYEEGLGWIVPVLEASGHDADATLRIDLLTSASWLALRLGRIDDARAWASEALERARAEGADARIAEALNVLGHLTDRAVDYPSSARLFREALMMYRQAGHHTGAVDALISLAGIEFDLGHVETAREYYNEAIATTSAVDHPLIHARAVDNLGNLLLTRGNAAEAIPVLERALAIYRSVGSVRGTAVSLDHLGKARRTLGDPVAAWDLHREALPLRREVGDPRGICVWLEAVASLLVVCRAYIPAARTLGAIHAIREQGTIPLHGHERIEHDWVMAQVRDRLDPREMTRAWSEGAAMTLVDAVEAAVHDAGAAIDDLRQREHRDLDVLIQTHGLTPREIDVLQCLTRRLTDKEIASELSISPRTVSTHVAVILGKLQVRSRRDAARIADSLQERTPST